jgi:hypothetical protein
MAALGGRVRSSLAPAPPPSGIGTVADRNFSRSGDMAMSSEDSLTTREIAEIFWDEIADADGCVSDTFDDGTRLFVRAVLPVQREVKARDCVQGGVALRATDEAIWVHPYVFRQVCQNGAIIAHATESRHLERGDFAFDPEETLVAALREAVQACCGEDAFERAADEMRSSVHSPVDAALALMPMLSRLPASLLAEFGGAIMEQFFNTKDSSRFGLMNAVTAVARDTRDPEVRWELERIGGEIPAEIHHSQERLPLRLARVKQVC